MATYNPSAANTAGDGASGGGTSVSYLTRVPPKLPTAPMPQTAQPAAPQTQSAMPSAMPAMPAPPMTTGVAPVSAGGSPTAVAPRVTAGGYPGTATPATSTGPAPTTAPGVASAHVTGIDPNADLRYSQITPQSDPRMTATQGMVDTAAQALSGGPNRSQLADQYLHAYTDATRPDFEKSLRTITQQNAAFGRLGSGMYGSDLVDAATKRDQGLNLLGAQLANDTASGTIQDQFNRVNSLSGLEGQQYTQNAGLRGELRGERTNQQNLDQTALANAIAQLQLQDQLANGSSNRYTSQLGALGGLGYGQQPTGALLDAGNQSQQQANGSYDALAQLLAQLGYQGASR